MAALEVGSALLVVEDDISKGGPSRKTSEVVRKENMKSQQDIVNQMSGNMEKARLRWSKIRQDIAKKKFMDVKDTDDGTKLIEKRLEEVRSMCSHSIQAEFFLSLQTQKVRNLIQKLTETPIDDFNADRRHNWRLIDLFRYGGRMAMLIAGAASCRKRYFKNETEEGGGGQNLSRESNMCSISKDLRNSLITRSKFRKERDLKLILWLLHSTKAFTHLFPAEMERLCATYVGYEKYDEGRILAYQNFPPDKFYFVIGGKINRIRQYKLTLGEVNKSLGFITKGMTTDPEEIEAETPRDAMMVAKGLVEVLVLQKAEYMELLRSTSGPPIDFLRRIDIFREFPCELFRENPDVINMRYFGANKIIVKDSNRTPWLHIVKSGCVKVARRQKIFDADRNRTILVNLALGRPDGLEISHAAELLGLSARQRREKGSALPCLPSYSHSCNSFGLKRSKTVLPIGLKSSKKVGAIKAASVQSEDPRDGEEEKEDSNVEPMFPNVPVDIQVTECTPPSTAPDAAKKEKVLSFPQLNNKTTLPRQPQNSMSPRNRDLNIATSEDDTADKEVEQRIFLTRERTQLSQVLTGGRTKNELERATFVQLDTLRTGDVFGFKGIQKRLKDDKESGLDHLGATLASEDVGLTLVSDGAEIVRISKRFFVANAENNTMLKVETLYKEYMSEDSAKDLLKEVSAWEEYKHLVITRSITKHSRRLK